MHTSCDGAIWLATDRSLAKLDDYNWTIQLTEFTGKIAGVDDVGRIWVVGEDYSEISAWNGDSWEVYGAEAGWVSVTDPWYQDYALWGQCDPAGRFWLATTQDVRVFDGERWTVFTPKDMGMGEVPLESYLPEFEMAILESTGDVSGDVWIGECDWAEGPVGGQGARWFDGLAWHGTDSPASQGCVSAIQEDSAGNVWLGVYGVLWRYTPTSGEWTSFAPPSEVPFDYRSHGAILHLAADPFDRLWVAELLCGGASCDAYALYHVRDGVWTLLPREEELYTVLELSTVTDAAGTAWLFGDKVYHLTETDVRQAAHLLPNSAAVDAVSGVWFIIQDYPQGILCTIDSEK